MRYEDDDDDDIVGNVDEQIAWLHELNRSVAATIAIARRGSSLWPKAEQSTPEFLKACAITRMTHGKDHVGIIADLEHRIRTGGPVDTHLVTGRPVRRRRIEIEDDRFKSLLAKAVLKQQVRYSGKAEGEAKYQKRRKTRQPQGDA